MIALFILSYGCSQLPTQPLKDKEDPVSVYSALNQAKASYLLGCVEAFKIFRLTPSFDECRQRAETHLMELQQIMDYNQ
jgi:hypothetical protein